MVFVVEPQFRVGHPIRSGADVSAHASRVGLERQHVQIAHHLHVFAALFALGNFDLDGG